MISRLSLFCLIFFLSQTTGDSISDMLIVQVILSHKNVRRERERGGKESETYIIMYLCYSGALMTGVRCIPTCLMSSAK